MRCDVLAIGTELLLGQIVDTNSAWIGEQLAASGIDSYEHRVLGDNLSHPAMDSLLGTTFYTLTGTHGTHVAIGVLWLCLMYVRSFKSAEPGEVLAAGTTIVTVGDLDHPWLRAYINETDLGRIKLGGKVQLTTDSFPGKTYQGTITYISPDAEFTPKQIQTKEERVKLVYRIKIEVDNANHELKNNMPVDAEIVL